jgi:hypothetical protein
MGPFTGDTLQFTRLKDTLQGYTPSDPVEGTPSRKPQHGTTSSRLPPPDISWDPNHGTLSRESIQAIPLK